MVVLWANFFCKNLFRTVLGIFSEFITVVLKNKSKNQLRYIVMVLKNKSKNQLQYRVTVLRVFVEKQNQPSIKPLAIYPLFGGNSPVL
jgi:hypothetical protein